MLRAVREDVRGLVEEVMARIEIDLDKKCVRCGKKGATQKGICLKCITKALENGELDHILDRWIPQAKSWDEIKRRREK